MKVVGEGFIINPSDNPKPYGEGIYMSLSLKSQTSLDTLRFDSPYIVRVKVDIDAMRNLSSYVKGGIRGEGTDGREHGVIFDDPEHGPMIVAFKPQEDVIPLEIAFCSVDNIKNHVEPHWNKVDKRFISRYHSISTGDLKLTQESLRDWKALVEYNLDGDFETLSKMFEDAPKLILRSIKEELDDYFIENEQKELVKKVIMLYA